MYAKCIIFYESFTKSRLYTTNENCNFVKILRSMMIRQNFRFDSISDKDNNLPYIKLHLRFMK